MADQNTATSPASKIAKAGPSVAGTFSLPSQNSQNNSAAEGDAQNQNNSAEGSAQNQNNQIANSNAGAGDNAAANQNNAGDNGTPAISQEEVTKFLESQGIKVEGGIEGIKTLIAASSKIEPTEEEKKIAEANFEKRMLDAFIAAGGTPESFVSLKSIASMDLKGLSVSTITHELKEAGFDDNEIQVVLKERYYQINPEELVQGDDETAADFEARKKLVEKKIAFGSKKLENRSSYIKQNAEKSLADLREFIKNQDLQLAEEAKLSSKVDEVASKLPRAIKVELDDVNGVKQDPVDLTISDSDIAFVVATLKDPAKRNNIFKNNDGSFNLEGVANLMLRNQILENALKTGYRVGGNRQVEAFEKKFPARAPHDLGVGGANQGGQKNGTKIHSAGRAEAVSVNK